MNQNNSHILAIAPSTVGFGFAVAEKNGTLINWGVKPAGGDKNKQSLAKLEALIAQYQPGVIVLENTSAPDSKRRSRIRNLTEEIVDLATKRKIKVELFSQKDVRKAFFADGEGTKYDIAEMIVKEFPEELSHRLPPKRLPWKSEDSRMDIFGAVALAMAFRKSKAK